MTLAATSAFGELDYANCTYATAGTYIIKAIAKNKIGNTTVTYAIKAQNPVPEGCNFITSSAPQRFRKFT